MWFLLLLSCASEPISAPAENQVQPPQLDRPTATPNGPTGQPPRGGRPQAEGIPQAGAPPQRTGFHPQPSIELIGAASEAPMSIVIISLDTVRADRLSLYGGRAEVSNLSQFAESGAVFENAISHFPETALSHWALLSGVMPEAHGNVPANSGSIYQGPMIADIVKKQGYSTGAFIGGVTLQDSACGLNRNFDVYDDRFQYNPEDMSRPGKEVTNRALGWIRKQKGPFFAFVHYFDAHFPYTPKPPWDTRYDPDYAGSIDGSDAVLRPYRDGKKVPSEADVAHVLALYDGEISELDATLAPLLNSLPKECIVVITADHGESFEHGYYFNHRGGLWEGITHVPLIIKGPNVPAARIDAQVGLIDVLPTVLELAGLKQDAHIQGRSLVSLMNGVGKGQGLVFSITDPWMPNPQFASRSETYKRIEGADVQIFDLLSDPNENSPLQDTSILSDSRSTYLKQLEPYLQRQHASPQQPTLSKEECARLEALGYTTCDTSPPK
ncbi:MAG: sulfatase [Myxococcota bacterium]